MRARQRLFALLIMLAGILPYSARAATISPSELPATIQSCLWSSCFITSSSAYDSGPVAAWDMVDFDEQGYQRDWLVRYQLAPPSGADYVPTESIPYGGYLWMRVQSSYSASDATHPVTLFLDHVTPEPESLNWFDTTTDLHLFLTSEDLIVGHASAFLADRVYDGYQRAGNLSGDLPLICLAEGCEISASLNLVQLTYALSGAEISMSGFNPSDTRSLVYSQGSYYDGYLSAVDPSGVTQSFYVAAVPEPDPSWLIGAGLLPILVAVRRRRPSA